MLSKSRPTQADDYSETGITRLGGLPDLTDPELFPTTDKLYWSFPVQTVRVPM